MSISPISRYTRVEVEQASGEARANEMGNRIETIAALKILDRDLSTPPGSPSEGDAYIVASSPTGAWAGHAGDIAAWYNGWMYIPPWGGMTAFIHDEKAWYGYSSVESEWHPLQDLWSTTEHWTGKYIGSSKVYSKVIDMGSLPNNTTKQVAHGITGLDLSKRILILPWLDDGGTGVYCGWGWRTGSTTELAFWAINSTNLIVKTVTDMTGYNGEARLEYCKT